MKETNKIAAVKPWLKKIIDAQCEVIKSKLVCIKYYPLNGRLNAASAFTS
ncbi:hypothetical protein BH09BAC4_BH09BAC4_25470 [soil metagenome]